MEIDSLPELQKRLAIYRAPKEAAQRLARARQVLAGLDDRGNKVHPSMFDADVISFAHGEGIRRPHPGVVAAGVRALLDTDKSSLENYLFLQRLEELDIRIADRFVQEGIDRDIAVKICIDSGTTRLFCAFLYAVANAGDVFVTGPAYYHPLASWCEIFDIELICLETQRCNHYKLTASELDNWLIRHTDKLPKGLFIFNPTMTGAIYSHDELSEIADVVQKYDLIVLEDAIFSRTEFDRERPISHLVNCKGMANRVVTIMGGSKVHGLANIRIGWGCGPNEIIRRMNQYTVITSATTPQIAKLMALAALCTPEIYIDENVTECRERVRLIYELVQESNELINGALGFVPNTPFMEIDHEPSAGHNILISFNGLQDLRLIDSTCIQDSIDVTRFLLKEAKVAVSPGISIGFNGCEVKLSYGCVGLHYTHSTVLWNELVTVLDTIQNWADLPQNAIDNLITQFPHRNQIGDIHSAFMAGRELIRQAFIERIIPAIIKLVQFNLSLGENPMTLVDKR